MKVVKEETVERLIIPLRRYIPAVFSRIALNPNKYLNDEHIDMIIERIDMIIGHMRRDSFDIPDPDCWKKDIHGVILHEK